MGDRQTQPTAERPADPRPALPPGEILNAYRWIVGRAPENEAATLQELGHFRDAGSLRAHLLATKAFQSSYWTLLNRRFQSEGHRLLDLSTQKVVFLHMPKAAGTTMHAMLEENFHKSEVFTDYRDVMKLPVRLLGRYKLFIGHFWLHEIHHIPGDKFVFTILREPRARILSLYRFHRALTATGRSDRHPLVPKGKLSLKDYLRDPEVRANDWVDNRQVRALFHLSPEMAKRYGVNPNMSGNPQVFLPRATLVEIAKENLAGLDTFGLVEKFDNFVEMLFRQRGLPVPGRPKRRNVTSNLLKGSSKPAEPMDFEEPDEEAHSLMDELVGMEEELYSFARGLHAQRLAALSTQPKAAE